MENRVPALTNREEELNRQINLRRLRAQLAAAQQAALDALRRSEHSKELFTCLGSEGFRRVRIKSGWDATAQIVAHTLVAAPAICDDIFVIDPIPTLSRMKLYKRPRKASEAFEEFLYDLCCIAKDCRLRDKEDLRIVEAFLTNCNDQDLLEKSLATYPETPTLNNVLEMAKRHKAARKNSRLAKTESKNMSRKIHMRF